MKKIDIIIPIYNAFADLQICLESLYKNTNLQENRLILINDNSPDDRIYPYLQAQQRENVIVIHNAENKGFSNNINIGISQSTANDVILLNSDTILTKNWVEKIVACAYSSHEIGTVTPLSNNATLCSVPNLFEENTLLEGLSVEEAAALVEECSLKKYPKISVANGFCMFVKREVIDLIGLFDAETFGRGYGEENDFCNRAEQMGYINVMCDDTYIYHCGTKSFVSSEKAKYIEEHERILYKRYPVQMKANERHCSMNPNKLIGENIKRYWDIHNGRRNVLYLLHYDFREGAENNTGGTQMHVKHLKDELKYENNIFVAAMDGSFLQITVYVGQREHVYRFFVGERNYFFQFCNRRYTELFKKLLVAFSIDLVHVHHVSTTSLDIFYEADKLNIPVIFTMHDFYAICPNINLRNHKGGICYNSDDDTCKECLQDSCKIYNQTSYVQLWRKQFCSALRLCDFIVVPSQCVKEIVKGYYPELSEKIKVISHGFDSPNVLALSDYAIQSSNIAFIEGYKQYEKQGHVVIEGKLKIKEVNAIYKFAKMMAVLDNNKEAIVVPVYLEEGNIFKIWIPNSKLKDGQGIIDFLLWQNEKVLLRFDRKKIKISKLSNNKSFNVAFIGGINELKGAKVIKKIISKSSAHINWYIFGNIGDADLLYFESNNLIKIGTYFQNDINMLFKLYDINAVCILSLCAETFSYTLSETLGAGIPPIVTNIGALSERVNAYLVGKTVEVENVVEETLDCLNEWCRDTRLYESEKRRCDELEMKTVSQMGEEYKRLLNSILQGKPFKKYLDYDRALVYEGITNTFGGERVPYVDNGYIEDVRNSLTWKLVTKIISLKFPFKDKIYKYLIKRRM